MGKGGASPRRPVRPNRRSRSIKRRENACAKTPLSIISIKPPPSAPPSSPTGPPPAACTAPEQRGQQALAAAAGALRVSKCIGHSFRSDLAESAGDFQDLFDLPFSLPPQAAGNSPLQCTCTAIKRRRRGRPGQNKRAACALLRKLPGRTARKKFFTHTAAACGHPPASNPFPADNGAGGRRPPTAQIVNRCSGAGGPLPAVPLPFLARFTRAWRCTQFPAWPLWGWRPPARSCGQGRAEQKPGHKRRLPPQNR